MLMSKIFNEDGGRRAVNCKLLYDYTIRNQSTRVLIETGKQAQRVEQRLAGS